MCMLFNVKQVSYLHRKPSQKVPITQKISAFWNTLEAADLNATDDTNPKENTP